MGGSFRGVRCSSARQITASISCGASSYLQPVVPLANNLGFVNAFTIPRNGKPIEFIVPRLATGISSHAEASPTLACGR